MKRALHRTAILSVLLLLLFTSKTQAATIAGTVCDSVTKEKLQDVIITSSANGATAFSDALGNYRLSNLPAGNITLRFFRLGYSPKEISLTLDASQTLSLNVQLGNGAVHLREVTITQGNDLSRSFNAISRLDKTLRPVNSAQDLLRLVPGLFIAQHAGGGKAEQIFLRGFDVDHGTDFAVYLDGMPVNIVSHAHGQGYADFHFVIPETVDGLNVYKGTYTTKFGDFATSGAGEFTTKNSIPNNLAKVECGMFNTCRSLLLLDVNRSHRLGKNANAYLAGEYFYSDSYFDSPQRLHRGNIFGKYTTTFGTKTFLSFSASAFQSSWNASGQVPERAVNEQLITRFGSIDNSEGGTTARLNANLQLTHTTDKGVFRHQLAYSYYRFDLFSDFTFFLNDPLHGDEIRQTEHGRNIFYYNSAYEQEHHLFGKDAKITVAVGTRADFGEISLSHAEKRVTLETIRDGSLYEQNLFAYADETIRLTEQLTVNAGVRSDNFVFSYKDLSENNFGGKQFRSRISPKMSFVYSPNETVQCYVRSGFGFHSNDARAVVSGVAGNSLPRAFGYETGIIFKVGKDILFHVAAWGLELENELVYVGDEGVVEISGPTRRLGADLGVRWEISKTLFADADWSFNHGRYVELPKGENFIPLAPSLTGTGGVTWKQEKGFSAALRYRYMNDRPANETNSVTAKGYFLLDAVAAYRVKRFEFGITAQNLLNSAWNEAQFATESRLQNEPMPVTELHLTPGTPFCVKGSVTAFF